MPVFAPPRKPLSRPVRASAARSVAGCPSRLRRSWLATCGASPPVPSASVPAAHRLIAPEFVARSAPAATPLRQPGLQHVFGARTRRSKRKAGSPPLGRKPHRLAVVPPDRYSGGARLKSRWLPEICLRQTTGFIPRRRAALIGVGLVAWARLVVLWSEGFRRKGYDGFSSYSLKAIGTGTLYC